MEKPLPQNYINIHLHVLSVFLWFIFTFRALIHLKILIWKINFIFCIVSLLS